MAVNLETKHMRHEPHTHLENLVEWYREAVRPAIVTSEGYMRSGRSPL